MTARPVTRATYIALTICESIALAVFLVGLCAVCVWGQS